MNPVQKKLQISEGSRIILINPPGSPESLFGGKPDCLIASPGESGLDGIIVFVKSQEDIKNMSALAVSAIRGDGLLWIAYPKKSSGILTDINRDKGWEPLLDAGWGPVRQVAIDDTWSALRWRPEKDIKRKPDSKFNK
jgi:hypothetical protein